MTLRCDVVVRRDGFTLSAALSVANETVALVGPNGAGKTTLLRCVAGLTRLDAGSIELAGQTLDDADGGIRVAAASRRVGVVFQDLLLFPHRSALDNVAYGLRVTGTRQAAARLRAGAWLEAVGLADRAHARPSELSGGQAQRVALARALATEPAALLLDEPLAALDVESRQGIRRQLRQHLHDFRGPVLLVTHDAVEAATLADRLVVLESGAITQAGTVEEITRRPRSSWAARLAGMNLYRGRARGTRVALDDGGALVVAERCEGDVFVAVPPAAVALFRTRPEGTPRNIWQTRADGFETFADRVRVHLAGAPPIIAEITPAAAADLDLAGGGTVYAAVKATEVSTYPR